jgi:hypothetical protein
MDETARRIDANSDYCKTFATRVLYVVGGRRSPLPTISYVEYLETGLKKIKPAINEVSLLYPHPAVVPDTIRHANVMAVSTKSSSEGSASKQRGKPKSEQRIGSGYG